MSVVIRKAHDALKKLAYMDSVARQDIIDGPIQTTSIQSSSNRISAFHELKVLVSSAI